MDGFHAFIAERDKQLLLSTIHRLKNEEFSKNKITLLHFVICCFHEAVSNENLHIFRDIFKLAIVNKMRFQVSNILKSHNIKPHWIFALDNLIRTAIEDAIDVLSPGI